MRPSHTTEQCQALTPGVPSLNTMPHTEPSRPTSTPGVSAWHCSVVWDGRTGEFLLTDLKSTYGTFLATGQKLTPGVACRLKAGDTFYLGEQSNALRVELG